MENRTEMETLVIGHRNPDTDSVAASFALAELKKLAGEKNVNAAVIGLVGERTEYLFHRFRTAIPPFRRDVYPRVKNILNGETPRILATDSLFSALEVLEKHRVSRLPVVDRKNHYCGMLSLFSMLGNILQTQSGAVDSGLTGRGVHSSIALINHVLEGEALSLYREDEEQDFEVYVAAMNIESFREHVPHQHTERLAIIVGDRTDIHLQAIHMGVRLMIVTGSRAIDPVVLQAAKDRNLSIIKTPLDSATVVRRLKFSCPVRLLMGDDVPCFRIDDCLSDIRNQVFADHDDIFAVVNARKELLGTFSRIDFDHHDFCRLVLVDHNEFDQSIDGIEEVPVVEVVDHHRFNMPPQHYPIKINCDIVGSTCTLVTEMFLQHKFKMPANVAGILMGGIISDTLLLRSPTSTGRDRLALDFLQRIVKIEPADLMQDIFKVGSVIAKSTPEEVLNADCKKFKHLDHYQFSISQVEEVSFDEFYARKEQLTEAAKQFCRDSKLDFCGLMITNVVQENSLLLAVGNNDILELLPYRKLAENLYDLPGVLSRKKQLLPLILKLLDKKL